MNSVRQIFRSRSFALSLAGIFLFQLVVLLYTTPLYDIDTNSFIRGGFSWDIYHNPFENLFIGFASKIWKNAWFLVSIHILVYAFSVSLLAHVLFTRRGWLIAAVCVAALEPVTMFYNFSLLPESFFASFTLVYAAFLVLWMREPYLDRAFLFGLMLGLAFVCKLSVMSQVPLLGMMMLRRDFDFFARLRHLAVAVAPFVFCYLFVLLGQKYINGGGLYTVAGRVRWDFSSSQYRPEEIKSADFRRFVDPYIVKDGKVEPFRELRRELSYLGYKDCLNEFELKTGDPNRAVACCDSIFDEAGTYLIKHYLPQAEWQFIKDNLYCIHHLNYLDYRYTPGMHFYHDQREYRYIDSLMLTHYGVTLEGKASVIPRVWRDMSFTNAYIPALWWAWIIALLITGVVWALNLKRRGWLRELHVLAVTLFFPILFHIVYISYRPRFLAPYFIIGLFLLLLLPKIRETKE